MRVCGPLVCGPVDALYLTWRNEFGSFSGRVCRAVSGKCFGEKRMSYIDGFVIAVPTANKQKFIEHAKSGDSVFIDLGATRVIECWEDDVPTGKLTDFRKAVNARADESVVFSWIEWPDKATRDAGMKTMMSSGFTDERMDPEKNPMPFDGKRLIYGGFSPIVEL